MGSKYLYHFTVIILSIVVFLCFIYPVNKKHLPFDVNDMIEGKYKKPYVYRTLIPTTIKIISLVIPEKIHSGVSDFVNQNTKMSDTFDNLQWDKRFALKYFISSFFMVVFFAAFGY